MSEPVKCYAVTSGSYSDYNVHAIYRRREDAEARVEVNNQRSYVLLDGEDADERAILAAMEAAVPRLPGGSRDFDGYQAWWSEHVSRNPDREDVYDMRVEEFDYYEGEPLPVALEER
jgi:hypothetical protein